MSIFPPGCRHNAPAAVLPFDRNSGDSSRTHRQPSPERVLTTHTKEQKGQLPAGTDDDSASGAASLVSTATEGVAPDERSSGDRIEQSANVTLGALQ